MWFLLFLPLGKSSTSSYTTNWTVMWNKNSFWKVHIWRAHGCASKCAKRELQCADFSLEFRFYCFLVQHLLYFWMCTAALFYLVCNICRACHPCSPRGCPYSVPPGPSWTWAHDDIYATQTNVDPRDHTDMETMWYQGCVVHQPAPFVPLTFCLRSFLSTSYSISIAMPISP